MNTLTQDFADDVLLIFVGHSDDASSEANAIVDLEATLRRDFQGMLKTGGHRAPFRSLALWEWTYDASTATGGQEAVVTPALGRAQIAIFVFKERVGKVTWQELEQARNRSKEAGGVHVLAIFPEDPPGAEKLRNTQAATEWATLLQRQEDLTADWTASVSRSITPLTKYQDLDHLKSIVRDRLREAIIDVLSAVSPPPRAGSHSPDGLIGTAQDISFDRRPILRHKAEELDGRLVEEFLSKPLSRQDEDLPPSATRIERLAALGCVTNGHPTVGAFLCFAPSLLMRDKFESCSLHLVRYSGTSRVTGRPEIRTLHDNLLNLFERGMQWLASDARLGRQGRVGSANRDDLEIPEIALREALANALVHRDYEEPMYRDQPTRIEVHDDRIEVTSYGALPGSVTVHQLNQAPEDLKPMRRNPVIAKVFLHMMHVELNATGIARMRYAMQQALLPPPRILEVAQDGVVVVRFQRPTLFDSRAGHLRVIVGEPTKRVLIGGGLLALADLRQAARDACLRVGMFPVMMEHHPADSADAIALSHAMVDGADIYVAILGHLYGYVPAGQERSVTELEYRRAKQRNMPRLTFLVNQAIEEEMDESESARAMQVEFRERAAREGIVVEVQSAEDLQRKLVEGLTRLLTDTQASERSDLLGAPRAEFAELPEPQRREIVVRYYEDCMARWSDDRYALDKRFVQLTLLLDQGEDTGGPRWQTASKTFHDLGEVLEEVAEQAVVVLGPPASGKSTLLRHYELDCARAALAGRDGDALSQAPLTFFVLLSQYQPVSADNRLPLPFDWLVEKWTARYPDLPALDTLLRERRLTLLLDALDEIPSAGAEPVRLWREFLRELARNYPGNRAVFSCRSLDYSASLSSKELPVPQVRIEPLSDGQVQEFVALHCPEHGTTLWQNLQGSPQLDLLRSPYYLKLLIAQTTAGDIPAGHAALFTGFVRQALQRETAGDHVLFKPGDLLHERDVQRLILARGWRTPFELPERGILLPKLSALAFQMQTQRSVSEAVQVRVTYDKALDMLDHPHAADIISAGAALGVLEQDLGRDEVLYVHQLIQEYFAARQLARQPQMELVQQEWHANRVVPSLQETLHALADADPLPPLPSTGWEGITMLAAAMASTPDRFVADLMARNVALAGRCAAQPEVTISDALKNTLRWALVERTQDASADLRARIAAGFALGELGDPRFARQQGSYGVFLLPPLVEIPGGTYRIGSDVRLYEDEAPVHDVTIGPFAIGQFPVTNVEWALFIQAGGYEEERWWETEAARAWRRGEDTAEGPKQQWRDERKYLQDHFDCIHQWYREGRITSKQAEDWEEIVSMSDDTFEALLTAWYPGGRQTQPACWHDEDFNSPAQPVVGICWFEARAYCAWLSVQTSQTFRLPTEAEWEAAACGTPHRRYAFGNNFDAMRCNTFETHIRRTTPIGIFPDGTTPEGLVDISGNTWDWTSSLYRPYPYNAEDGREDPTHPGAYWVIRGGAWFDNPANVRTSCRRHNDPGTRNNGIGLRVVRSSSFPPGLD